MNLTPRRRATAFTFVELLVSVTVLMILLAVGVPAFTELMARTRLTQVTNTLVGHLHLARSAAVKRGRERVAIGPYDSSGDDWLASDHWEGGYMVAIVALGATPTIREVLRRVDGADLRGLTITTNNASPRFYFQPDGTSSVSATLTICDEKNPDNARAVVVDNVGRVRASGYRPGGDPLVCPPD